jgi:hypothetical protein
VLLYAISSVLDERDLQSWDELQVRVAVSKLHHVDGRILYDYVKHMVLTTNEVDVNI